MCFESTICPLHVVFKALKSCLDELWCDKLVLVQDSFSQQQGTMFSSGWQMTAEIYEHLRVLSSVLPSTKETLENCVGDITDHRNHDSKSGKMRPERMFYFYSSRDRLKRAPADWVNPADANQNDFLNAMSRSYSRNSGQIFGVATKVHQKIPADMKLLLKAGHSGCYHVKA